jgi:cell division protein FtsB
MLIVLAVVLALYVQQGLSLLSVRGEADQQAAIVKQLSRQNAQLRRQANSLNSPSTIMRDARALGMIKPGEKPYVVTGLPDH